MSIFRSGISVDDYSFFGKLRQISWGMVFLICVLACVGFMCLYSAANGSLDPYASRQIPRFMFALCLLVGFALIDIRWIFRAAYPFYALTIILLILVDIFGHIGMGAQRWIDLGFISLQPSCGEPDAKGKFQCRCDGGGYHVTYDWEKEGDTFVIVAISEESS